jgi:transcriptional regulator with XRE-family HTH domain
MTMITSAADEIRACKKILERVSPDTVISFDPPVPTASTVTIDVDRFGLSCHSEVKDGKTRFQLFDRDDGAEFFPTGELAVQRLLDLLQYDDKLNEPLRLTLRALRKRLNYRQAALKGVDQSRISKIETGARKLYVADLLSLFGQLDMPFEIRALFPRNHDRRAIVLPGFDGASLRAFRETYGNELQQNELASRVNVDPSTISKREAKLVQDMTIADIRDHLQGLDFGIEIVVFKQNSRELFARLLQEFLLPRSALQLDE